jgi:hypothetical protein
MEADMEATTSGDVREQQQQPQNADKLVMRSVISYDKLLGMIEERNPILARREQRRRPS